MSAARRLYRRPSRALVAAGTALATIAAYAGLSAAPAPAHADASPGVDDIRAFFGTLTSQTLPSLASVGALSQQLKTLNLAPGGDTGIGLSDLLAKAKSDVLDAHSSWATANTLSDVASQIDGASHALSDSYGGGNPARSVTFHANSTGVDSNGVQTLHISFDATRTNQLAGMTISSATPEFAISSGDGVRAVLTLHGALTIANNPTTGQTWLVDNGTDHPAVTVGVDATIPTPNNVHAGLGILGVRLADDSTFHLMASASTSWSDPNNDGRLAFSENGVAGELATNGSGPGIVTAQLDSASIHADLHVQARPTTGASLNLPSTLDATVHVDQTNLVTGDPIVSLDSPTALDAVRDFLTLSPRDLAQGIAQATSALMVLQQQASKPLPFMSGSVTDAITAAESLAKFLKDNVSAVTSPTTPGTPSFASIQDLLDKLHNATGMPTGTTLDVNNANYDQAARKLYFTIRASRTSGHSRPLDPVAPTLTGSGTGVHYSDTTLQDDHASFDPVVDGKHDFRDALIGRTIQVGASSAAIKSVLSPTTLLLDRHAVAAAGSPDPTSAWRAGTPAAGAAYVIAADDPKTGLVQLGNTLQDGGVANANATTPQATFDPSYSLTIPLALDLRPADTDHCDPDHPAASGNCPFSYHDPVTGVTRIISSLPSAADRILIKGDTDLLTADVTINTHVDVNATVGFFGVKLSGDLAVCDQGLSADDCTTGTASDHFFSLHLGSLPGADAQGYVPLKTVFTQVHDSPSTVLTASVKGQAAAHLTLSIPGAENFFPSGTDLSIGITMDDITDPSSVHVTQHIFDTLSQLNFDPSNPQALLSELIAILHAVHDQSGSLSTPGMDTKLPLVGKSLSELIEAPYQSTGLGTAFSNVGGHGTLVDPSGSIDDSWIGRTVTVGSQSLTVARVENGTAILDQPWAPVPSAASALSATNEFDGFLTDLSNNTPTSLQDLVGRLGSRLGTGSTAGFSYLPASGSDPQRLKLTIDWKRNAATAVPLNLHFDLGDLVGSTSQGLLHVTANGEVQLALTFPLTAAAVAAPLDNLTVDKAHSFIKAGVGVTGGDDISLNANLGPFVLALGGTGTQIHAGLAVSLDAGSSGDVSLGDFISGLSVHVVTDNPAATCSSASAGDTPLALCAFVPATLNGAPVGTAGHSAFVLRLPLSDNLSDVVDISGHVTSDPASPMRFEAPDKLGDAFANAALNLLSLKDGFLGYLTFLENGFRTASFNGKLPLIGHDLQAGADFVGGIRTSITSAFDSVPGDSSDTKAIKDFLNGPVKDALPVLPGTTFTPHVYCGGTTECTDDQSGASITGISITADIGGGDVDACPSASDADESTKCAIAAHVPVDLGLPGLSVKSTDGNGVQGGIAWSVHLTLGIDRNAGFFVATGDASKPEVKVAAHLRVPNAALQLAFINVGLTRLHPDVPEFAGTFAIDLTKPGTAPCYTNSCPTNGDQLTLADVTSHPIGDIAHVQLTAAATIDWRLRARADAVLPGIGADFHLHWDWDSTAPSTTDGGSGHGLTQLGFDNIVLDPGSFLRGAVGQVVGKIAQVYKPIKPILDTIQAPIPVLSDLSKAVGGDDVTIESLALAFSTVAGGPESLATFFRVLDIVKQVGDTVSTLGASQCGATPPDGDPHADGYCIDLGAIDLVKDKALNTQNSPDSAASSYTVSTAAPSASSFKSELTSKGGFNPDSAHDASNPTYGFTFPLFSDPTKFFGIIVGQDVDLVNFDSGPLTIGFEFSQEFGPVYAPPPVMVVISGGASVSIHIVAGFDTYGIRTAVEQGRPAEVLNGLFFRTTDEHGKPIPVVHFEGFVAAGAAVSIAFLEVGIEGGIKLTVDFTWNDPNNDGKFRFGEFLSAAINNPICLFNVGGELSLFIKVFVTLGVGPFSVSFDFTLANIKLLDFSLKPNCTPPPPKLAGVDDSTKTLYIYAGKFSHGQRGDSAWDSHNTADETWVIRQVPPHAATDTKPATNGAVVVQGLGITESFDDGAAGNKITSVVLDGRGYQGKLSVTLTGGEKDQPFTKSSFIYTGDKDDVIRGGAGHSVIDAGDGSDQITTIDRQDLTKSVASSPTAFVAGGPGKDTITVGNAADWVEGDGQLTTDSTETNAVTKDSGNNTVNLDGVINPATATHRASNALVSVAGADQDTISVGLGGSTVYGGGGDDTIGTANDAPQTGLANVKNDPAKLALYRAQPSVIVGGDGADRIKGGSAGDTIYTGDEVQPGENGLGSADNAGSSQNTVDTGTGNDTVYGSQAPDFITTHSLATTNPVQHATVYGGGGEDVLIGGAGTDALYGGPGDDYVIAEPATVSADKPLRDVLGTARSVVHLPLSTPSSTKTLVGGGGSDRIYGGDGDSVIYGDRTDAACPSAPSNDYTQPTETTQPSGLQTQEYDAADLVLGGNGVDRVYAGGGDDHVFTYGGMDTICGAAGIDDLHGGPLTDGIWGGTGDDKIYGEDGADDLFGNDNNDEIYGQDGADLIEGNKGTDTISGGLLDDVIIGGSSAAGVDDVNDYLYGDAGNDVLIGDDTTSTGATTYPSDLSGSPSSAGGADYIYGGADNDRAYGGLASDHIYGGLNNDHLEGNTAHDYVYGEDGADDIIGGSSAISSGTGVASAGWSDEADTLSGGNQDDVIAGDNAIIEKTGAGLGSTLTRGRALTSERSIQLLDLGYGAATGLFGGDDITGGAGNDVVFGQRGVEHIHGDTGDDYVEGGQDADFLYGDGGQDDLVGGSYADQGTRAGQLDGGDTISGGDDGDVALGDNGLVTRDPDATASDLVAGRGIATRSITLYDVIDGARADTSGADWIQGDGGSDVLLGQDKRDRVQGGDASDYVEGGQEGDWLEGNAGSDDIVGGGSEILGGTDVAASGVKDTVDVMWGGSGDDVLTGDNARVTRTTPYDDLTNRIGTVVPGTIEERRAIRLLDLQNGGSFLIAPDASRYGADLMSGQGGNDVLLGQDGNDSISGGSNDDYVEGQGGSELIQGDLPLSSSLIPADTWFGSATANYAVDNGAAGQDDLIGGSSRPKFRDTGDEIHGNDGADFILGDGGTAVRYVDGTAGSLVDRINSARYPSPAPATAAKLRHSDSHYPSTRFCTTELTNLCEPALAGGDDKLYGDGGDDVMYGQDGNDQMWGGTGDDDMFGELGNDLIWGEDGDDAILGDRGGLVDTFQNGSNQFTIDNSQVPKIHYDGFVGGTVTRKVDLLHDNDGAAFVGSSGSAAFPHGGMLEGGDDRIRGGNGRDSIHAGFGEDLVNGDSGGDTIFGDDGADVLWGGRGIQDVTADPNTRGAYDSNVDYIFGGKGGATDDTKKSTLGSDVIDWRPRGAYGPAGPTTCAAGLVPQDYIVNQKATNTVDPCLWFEMTDITTGDVTKYQHHQGIDWIYGGWDRDVLQADVADNGPNQGDRLLDWNGAYNIYTHCNSAYGGYNDVRQHSPAQQDFLQRWSWSVGAGQVQNDALTSGTSAFDELAIVYPGSDNDHGSGPAYSGTPGHFDNPNACAP